ncbi:MAG: GAF domain-containing protein [Deltaproteobacteria bacterium]|jgi:signal transduction protein with GAF and PtsI domain|nr:GAF domain-containing protein [Deltaproteobacteria bacterium]
MAVEEKIDIDIYKVVFRAIAESDNLEIMANHLTQLMVAALEIKGCTLFALNPETDELEILASFGLSMKYLNKGPLLSGKSIGATLKREPVVIRDVQNTDRLQYPDDAKSEGIGAIISVPIIFNTYAIGALRLYHHSSWEISEKDVDSLLVLAENIGLAMTYTRLLNALQTIRYTLEDIQPIGWEQA